MSVELYHALPNLKSGDLDDSLGFPKCRIENCPISSRFPPRGIGVAGSRDD
jgi:hypothetical protein